MENKISIQAVASTDLLRGGGQRHLAEVRRATARLPASERFGLLGVHPLELDAIHADAGLVGGLFAYAYCDFVVVEAIWVKPGQQRLGLGSALLEATESFARRLRCGRILASCLNIQNEWQFWEKAGFQRIGQTLEQTPGPLVGYFQKNLAPLNIEDR